MTNQNPSQCCGGKGNCYQPDQCYCQKKWYGSNCQMAGPQPSFTCYGYSPTNTQVCNGHGICAAQDVCYCAYGYGGQKCECSGNVCEMLPDCECPYSNSTIPGKRECVCDTDGVWIINGTDVCNIPQGDASPLPDSSNPSPPPLFLTRATSKQQEEEEEEEVRAIAQEQSQTISPSWEAVAVRGIALSALVVTLMGVIRFVIRA